MNKVSFPHLGLDFSLNETVNFFGIGIHWYGIIIGIGLFVAILIGYSEFKKHGYKTDDLLDFLLFAVPLGILGARCYYVIFKWDYYSENLSEIIAIWEGGLAIYGGIIVGIIVAVIWSKIKKIPFLWFADMGSIGLFIAQSVGRWGNFVNGEAYGSKTTLPWGMIVNGEGPVHPTFLYESLWNFTGFLISYLLIYKRKHADGASLAYYLIWYGAGRFLIEGLRSDSLYLTGNIRVSQVVAIISVISGAVLLLMIKKRGEKKDVFEEK